MPKTVLEVTKEREEFKITLSDNKKETIKAVNLTWDKVFNKGIKGGCKIEISDTTDGKSHKLSCNNDPDPQKLEEFKVTE